MLLHPAKMVSLLQEPSAASMGVMIKIQFHKGVCLTLCHQASLPSFINPALLIQPAGLGLQRLLIVLLCSGKQHL